MTLGMKIGTMKKRRKRRSNPPLWGKMIDKFSGFCSEAFSTLLDAYQMKDWEMSWEEFIIKAQEEINANMEKWKGYAVGEEEE